MQRRRASSLRYPSRRVITVVNAGSSAAIVIQREFKGLSLTCTQSCFVFARICGRRAQKSKSVLRPPEPCIRACIREKLLAFCSSKNAFIFLQGLLGIRWMRVDMVMNFKDRILYSELFRIREDTICGRRAQKFKSLFLASLSLVFMLGYMRKFLRFVRARMHL